MDIFVVHWKIKPTHDAEQAFLEYWNRSTPPSDVLIGEYLSRPLSKAEAGVECQSMDRLEGSGFKSFFNVGMWESAAAFGDFLRASRQTELNEFEAEPRRRMALRPIATHRGSLELPGTGDVG
jgi:hypothetical protein